MIITKKGDTDERIIETNMDSRRTSLIPLLIGACGGGGDNGVLGGGGGGDFLKLTVDSGGETTYTDTYDATTVCDPRIDWYTTQILLMAYFDGSQFLNQLVINFDPTDAVGSYDVTAGEVMALYTTGGVTKAAWDLSTYSNSSGTVAVTQSDTRIKGSFTLVVVDDTNSNPVTLTGSFDVEDGVTVCQP